MQGRLLHVSVLLLIKLQYINAGEVGYRQSKHHSPFYQVCSPKQTWLLQFVSLREMSQRDNTFPNAQLLFFFFFQACFEQHMAGSQAVVNSSPQKYGDAFGFVCVIRKFHEGPTILFFAIQMLRCLYSTVAPFKHIFKKPDMSWRFVAIQKTSQGYYGDQRSGLGPEGHLLGSETSWSLQDWSQVFQHRLG